MVFYACKASYQKFPFYGDYGGAIVPSLKPFHLNAKKVDENQVKEMKVYGIKIHRQVTRQMPGTTCLSLYL